MSGVKGMRSPRLPGGRDGATIRPFEPNITVSGPLAVDPRCICTWVPGWPGWRLKFIWGMCPVRHPAR